MKLIDRISLWHVKRRIKRGPTQHTDKCPTFAYQKIEHNGRVLIDGARDVNIRFELFDLPGDLRGYHVLDVGCNIGAMSLELKRRGANRVVGIDVDSNIIDCARTLKKLCNLEIEYYCTALESMEEIPELADAWFDIIILTSVWRHVQDKDKAKKVLSRHCTDILLFEEMDEGDASEVSTSINFVQGRCLGISERQHRQVFEFRRRSPYTLTVNGHGYEIVKQWRVPWSLSQRPEQPGRIYYKLRMGQNLLFAKQSLGVRKPDIERSVKEFKFLKTHYKKFRRLLLRIHDIEVTEYESVWVGDYFESIDLETFIRKNPPTPLDVRLGWAKKIIEFYCDLIARGIIFGHIACRNVMVSIPSTSEIRLCDFEGVGMLSKEQNLHSLTALILSIILWRPQEDYNSYSPNVFEIFKEQSRQLAEVVYRDLVRRTSQTEQSQVRN